jgi:hypothetical protein
MKSPSTDAAQLSQIEISQRRECRLRVVLLGASNLSLQLRKVVALANEEWGRPLEFHVAKGFGRSYGRESGFLGKKISGILSSRIWEAISRSRARATIALIADVGNDLGYESAPEEVVDWVASAVERLHDAGAVVALNNLPLESVKTLGPTRYAVLRRIFFPCCRLRRDEMIERAERLSALVDGLAANRRIPVFSGEKSWYGWDPIHPRRGSAALIWRRMIEAIKSDLAPPVSEASPDADESLAVAANGAARESFASIGSLAERRWTDRSGNCIALY